MSNDDPFTLDLFNNTALSSGLRLGVTAFGGDFLGHQAADTTRATGNQNVFAFEFSHGDLPRRPQEL